MSTQSEISEMARMRYQILSLDPYQLAQFKRYIRYLVLRRKVLDFMQKIAMRFQSLFKPI